MRPTLLAAFVDVADRFAAAPDNLSAMNRLVSARMFAVDMGAADSENWPALARVLIALATAAQESAERADRRAAIAQILALALDLWRADLGENVMQAPKAPAAPIRQYRED